MIDRIQARRDALATKQAQAKQEYQQIEDMLRELNLTICAMHGGLAELDALLEDMQHGQEDQQPQRGQPDQPDHNPQTDHDDS